MVLLIQLEAAMVLPQHFIILLAFLIFNFLFCLSEMSQIYQKLALLWECYSFHENKFRNFVVFHIMIKIMAIFSKMLLIYLVNVYVDISVVLFQKSSQLVVYHHPRKKIEYISLKFLLISFLGKNKAILLNCIKFS